MELPKGWRKTVERRLDYQFEVRASAESAGGYLQLLNTCESSGLQVDMRFGASEITVVARDPRSHNAVAVRVDWR